ncbi:MAG: hypothetical protein QME16_00175 [Planctomycetota bacterium]|nr:hypothetical protein [Planctomycetota bacterium]
MKPEDIKLWFARIQRCEDLQATKTNERKQIMKLYTGTFFGSPVRSDTEISEVNFVYEYMQVLVSAIYARNPHIFCRTKNARLGQFAETMELAINHYWYEKQAKKKIKQSIIDGILQPPGFIEIGYFLFTEKSKAIKTIEAEFPELKDVGNVTKTEEEQGIVDETIKEDDVFLSHLSPWDLLFPDGYHDIRECPYLIKKQVISLDKILANPSFKSVKNRLRGLRISNSAKISPVSAYNMKALPSVGGNYEGQDEELVKITLYHIFDRTTHKRITLAKNFTEDSLYDGDWDYFIDGFPIYPLIFNEIPRSDEDSNAFPLSDIVPMIPQLKEISLISSAMLRHRKRAGTLLLGKRGAVSEPDASKIQNASDVDFILLDDITENAVKGFTPPALPQDFYRLREIILQDLIRRSGYNQLLGTSEGIQTATESENVRAGALLRQSEKVDTIEDFTVMIAKGLAGMIWQFIPRERVAEIIGEMPTEEMWPSLPEDVDEARRIVQRELLFRIEAGSTRPAKDEAVERKQWMDLMGIIKANFPNRLNDSIILPQLLKKFDFKDIDRAVVGYDEQEVQTAQEENKLLLKGIPCIPGPNENSLLHLQVHSQAYQSLGLQITPQMDEHIMKTKQYYEMKNPQVIPQKGDSKIAPQTTAPEQRRGGVTEFADIVGGVRSAPGVGGNRGGM